MSKKTQTNKPSETWLWQEYERRKQQIPAYVSHVEYEDRVRKIAKELGL